MKSRDFKKCAVAWCNGMVKLGAFKYCSIKCAHVIQRNDHSHGSKESFKRKAQAFLDKGGVYGYVAPNFLARVLKEHYGELCIRCGWSSRNPKTGKVPIEVEHIDGNWENSRLNNLTLLCPNCHALTPTFRGLNRGRGRAYRLGIGGSPKDNYQEPTKRNHCAGAKVLLDQPMQLELLQPT
jgi:hypothetical protein